MVGEPPEAGGDVRLPPREGFGVGLVEGDQPWEGAHGRRLGDARRARERRVVSEDRLLQLDQVRAGVQAQLFAQHCGGAPQDGEGLGLSPSPVQRGRQELPPPLALRLLGDQALGEGDELAGPPAGQTRLEALLLGRLAQVLQAQRLAVPSRPVEQLGIGRASPQDKRVVPHHESACGVAGGGQGSCAGHEAGEGRRIELRL